MTLQMATCTGSTGKVFSFEPLLSNFRRLSYAIDKNHTPWVIPRQAAVSEVPGTVKIYQNKAGLDGSLASLRPDQEGGLSEEVQAITLDDEVKMSPRLIKVDVEGAEVGVIRGAKRLIAEAKPHWIVEYNPSALARFGHKMSDIYNALTTAGVDYELIPIGYGGRPLSKQNIENGAPESNYWCRPIAR